MDASRDIVADFGLDATRSGCGARASSPSDAQLRRARHGLEAGLVTAVDLVRGLGVLTGIEVVEVEGATGWYDTNYEGKRDAASTLADGADLFIIHVEATDEAGHAGNVEEKVRALENWDRASSPTWSRPRRMGPWRLLLLPDHATPLG
jgi:2,3-bisphosphoglycerate-independent phosphoglycerate mutase